MRIVTPITLLALAAAGASFFANDWTDLESLSERLESMPFTRGATEAEVAVEVRCGELDSWMRSTCEAELTRRFAVGDADPARVLRVHCTRARTVWEQTLPAPPPLCAARFGGWLLPQPRQASGQAA